MLKICLLACVAFLLSGCAHHVVTNGVTVEPVGFFYGLLHGFILPFSWIISLFDDEVAIYAVYNDGGWYDFGFILGFGAIFRSGHRVTS